MTLQEHLPTSSARVDALMADFKGLDKLDDIVTKVLERLVAKDSTQRQAQTVRQGGMSVQEFDGWFSELIRVELGRTLGIVRNKAIQKAAAAGAGSAASAVYRRLYKNSLGGNINICGNRGRISSKRRVDMRPVGGKSGIIRERSIRKRTEDINEYYGPDRHFILRFLNEGTDVRVATPEGPTGRGSRATYGNRSNITAKGFFHTLRTDMEQAAQQLGETLIGRVEKWADQQFTDIDNAS